MEQKEIVELIAGYFTGQLEKEQLNTLRNWLQTDKGNQQFFDEMRELWLASAVVCSSKSFDKAAAYQLFLSRIDQKRVIHRPTKEKQPGYIWWIRIAAAVITGFLAGAFYVYWTTESSQPSQLAYYETIVPFGSKSRLVLADGTKVCLNAGSKFRYASDFGQKNREVYLEGEGYFDVAHDTTKIFVVKTDKIDVKALGTSFNVKAYLGEDRIETVLVDGKVTIGDLVLAPNEKCVYHRKNERLIVERKIEVSKKDTLMAKMNTSIEPKIANVKIVETPIDPIIYTSWKDELWKIERETLGSIAVQLERRYDVHIRFADRGAQALNINALIKDESLEQVLRFLQLSLPIDFDIKGKVVMLKEDKYLKEKYKEYYRQK